MTFGLIASILVSTVTGFCILCVFLSFKTDTPSSYALRLFLGGGLGIGLLSCLFFLFLLAFEVEYLVIGEVVLMLLLATLCFIQMKRGSGDAGIVACDRAAEDKFRRVLPLVFVCFVLSSIISFVLTFLRLPHGQWDAWIIWNLHARFIFRGGEHWTTYLTSSIDWTHPDYPLLLPLSVARCWIYAGMETQYAPMILSALFTFSVIGLIVSSLSILRSRYQGYLGGMLLMGSPLFITHGASQLADIPISFFFLATLIVLAIYDHSSEDNRYLLLLAGVMAGLSAWTKNEGLLFVIVVIGARVVVGCCFNGWRKSMKQVLSVSAGALPVLFIVFYFKIRLAPQSDLFSDESMKHLMQRMEDPQRYYQILTHYLHAVFSFTGGAPYAGTGYDFKVGVVNIILLFCYLILVGIGPAKQDRISAVTIASVVGTMLVGYFFVYVTSPQNLEWHLFTSLYRLFIQLWPLAIFLCLLVANIPEKAFEGNSLTHRRRRDGQSPPRRR